MAKILLLVKHITQYLACGFLFMGVLSSPKRKRTGYWEIALLAVVQTFLTVVMGDKFPTAFLGVLVVTLGGLYHYLRGREKLAITLLISLDVYALSLYLNMALGSIIYIVITASMGEGHIFLIGICNIILFCFVTLLCALLLYRKKTKIIGSTGFYSLSVLCGIVLACNIAVVLPNYMSKTRFEWFFSLIALVAVAVILVGAHESWCEQKRKAKLQDHIRELSSQVHHFKEYLPAVKRICDEQLQDLKTKANGSEVAKEFMPFKQGIERMYHEQMEESRKEFLRASAVVETGMVLLDAMLQDFQRRMEQENILFQVQVYTSPLELIRKGKISQSKLMELLGDSLANAIHAIIRKNNRGEETIELHMGISQESGFYEIDIYDSGIPFPENILREFGRRGLTTGGTGEGLANMLETLKKYRISLAITEYAPIEEFSKCINFCFAGDFEVAYYGERADCFELYVSKQE